MNKKKMVCIASSILILLAFGAYCYINLFYPKIRMMEQNKKLMEAMEETIQHSDTIDFAKVTDFQWDKLYVITPYMEPKKVLEEDHVKWKRISSTISTNDGVTLLVFTHRGEIIAYVDYPRNKGDFKLAISQEFDKDRAIFTIKKSNSNIEITAKQ